MNPILFVLFLWHFSFFSQASQKTKLSPPFSLAQGGSGGASLQEDFSYLINPATMGFQKKTKGMGFYSFKQNQQTALLSLVDLNSKFPMAITYQRFWSEAFQRSEKDKMFFSSGFKVASYLSLGFTVETALKKFVWNGSLGSVLKLGKQTSLALFINPVLKTKDNNQRVVSVAAYHRWKPFFITKLDVAKPIGQKWIFKGGLESVFQKFFSLRLGGTWVTQDREGRLSGGLVFYGPKVSVEYSVEQDQNIYQHAVAVILRM